MIGFVEGFVGGVVATLAWFLLMAAVVAWGVPALYRCTVRRFLR